MKLQQPRNYDFRVSQFNLPSQSGNDREMTTSPPGLAISAASYRGAKCPTSKTAEKKPKRVPSGSRQNSRKTAGKTPETPEKQSKQLFFGCFGCFSGCFSAVLPWPTRHPFRLFFGCFRCRAFGTSVAGRRDCKPGHHWEAKIVPITTAKLQQLSSDAWRGAPDGVATLKVRKGAFDALNKGSGALAKVK